LYLHIIDSNNGRKLNLSCTEPSILYIESANITHQYDQTMIASAIYAIQYDKNGKNTLRHGNCKNQCKIHNETFKIKGVNHVINKMEPKCKPALNPK
jgi:hypothetical protein